MMKRKDIETIVEFIKKEPRTIDEISKLINKSWVTTNKYILQIISENPEMPIKIKILRKGSYSSLKIIYFNNLEKTSIEELKERLYGDIKKARYKTEFDFMDIFQYIKDDKKRLFADPDNKNIRDNEKIVLNLKSAQNEIYIFSGNLSFINKKGVLEEIEDCLKRKAIIRIIARINFATADNLNKLRKLVNKYPKFLYIKHHYQPLRGVIIDSNFARFTEKLLFSINDDVSEDRIYNYEIYDSDWIDWFKDIFWNIFRVSANYLDRLNEIKKIE